MGLLKTKWHGYPVWGWLSSTLLFSFFVVVIFINLTDPHWLAVNPDFLDPDRPLGYNGKVIISLAIFLVIGIFIGLRTKKHKN